MDSNTRIIVVTANHVSMDTHLGGIVMEDSKHILLVVNSLSKLETAQIQTALAEMQKEGLKLKISVLYVKPHFPSCYLHIPTMFSLSEDFEEEAKDSLNNVSKQLDIPTENQWIATGRVKSETFKIAATLGVDCILASSNINKQLGCQIKLKKNDFQLPIVRTVSNLAA